MNKWTVVVTCYQYGRYLPKCIDSIMANQCDKTVVVVDDCSPDNTEEVTRSLQYRYPGLRYIKNHKNLGLSEARNIGITAFPSEYVCCFDADDWMSHDCLPLSEKVLEKHDVALTDQEIVDESRPGDFCLTIRGDVGVTKLVAPESVTLDKLKNGIGGQPRGRLITEEMARDRYQCFPSSSTYRRACWEEAGGYDGSDTMRLGWEDFEFFIRLAKMGKSFGKVHGDHCYHRVHSKHKMHYSAESMNMSYEQFANTCQWQIWEYLFAKHPDVWGK